MSSISTAAARRRRYLLATSFLIAVCLSFSTAHAQQTASADELPAIEVSPPANRSRVEPSSEWASRLGRLTRTPAPQPAPVPQPSSGPAPAVANAAPDILAGAATTV